VGDSGAAYLGDGLVRQGPGFGIQVRNAGTIGCGLITAGGRLRLDGGGYRPDPEWCGDWPARWRAELVSFEPDVALLVIGWPGLGDREVEGRWRHPCDPVFDAAYAAEVRHAVDVLASTGARVVVADVPYLTLPVVQRDAAERVECLNAIYRDAGVDVLGLSDWLCESSSKCTIEQDGVTLRSDGVHFRDDGADVAAAWVLPELLAHAGEEQRTEHRERRR